jgi:RNA polymerase-interacting CarD/CdnL/TRCF family regulator
MNPVKGDVVVLPQHGLCLVIGRRVVTYGLKRSECLSLKVMSNDHVVTLPVVNLSERNLRAPITLADFDAVLAGLAERKKSTAKSWSRRFKRNQALLHSGHILEVVAVVRDLSVWSQKNPLSAAEQTMYDRAYTNLIAEMKHAATDFDIDVVGLVANALLSPR